jgi:hypothetical protein
MARARAAMRAANLWRTMRGLSAWLALMRAESAVMAAVRASIMVCCVLFVVGFWRGGVYTSQLFFCARVAPRFT